MMKLNIPAEIQQLATNTYRMVREKVEGKKSITVLHIDDEFCFMVHGTDALHPEKIWSFDIGSVKTARDFFNQFPPTPGEIESAIQVVEDEVMPLNKLLMPGTALYSADPCIREIAQYALFEETRRDILLASDSMERVFNRLAAIITGLPASQDVLPASNEFAATLLILREVMHHLGFKNITIPG